MNGLVWELLVNPPTFLTSQWKSKSMARNTPKFGDQTVLHSRTQEADGTDVQKGAQKGWKSHASKNRF